MLDCYGCNTLGDGPSVTDEMRLIYGDNPPPQYVDPWGNPVEVPQMLDSELMATAAGEPYREFWRNWREPVTADQELTAFHNEQRDFYQTMPAAPLTRAPFGPTILYRPEDAAPREPVVTDVQYLAPVTGYGPQSVAANLDPYGLNRTQNVGYVNYGVPADGYGPPTPVLDPNGNIVPINPVNPITPINPVTGTVPVVSIGTEPRPNDPSGYVSQPGDGPVTGGGGGPATGGAAPWWLAIAALLAATL